MAFTISRLGHHGDGIAKGPVFAARTLPGEVIDGQVVDGRIAVPKIITPSVDRVAAPCRHYKSCGGCSLQHASDAFVAEWKQDVVISALAAQNLDAEIRKIQTSPAASRRRAVFTGRRTKKGALVGFHARASDVVSEMPDCKLLKHEILAVVPLLRKLTVLGASRKSEIRLTVTSSDVGADVLVNGAKPLDAQIQMELAALAAEHGLARLTWGTELAAGIATPYQVFETSRVAPPAGSFLQATKDGEDAMVLAVKNAVQSAKHIVDLFSGCGTFSLPLSGMATVHAVEGDAEMLAALDKGWRQTSGLKKITTETRDLFRRPLTPDELGRFDAVVIDPPRAGAEQQFRQIAAATPATVVAISCNPVSFARDAKTLIEAGYEMGPIDVIDQFRWSTHVELVAAFNIK